MKVQEHHFTSCASGRSISGYGGFHDRASSPGLDGSDWERIGKVATYVLPLDGQGRPFAPEQAPPSLNCYRLRADQELYAITHVVATGRTPDGRDGNIYAHTLVAGPAQLAGIEGDASQLLGHAAWRRTDSEDLPAALPEREALPALDPGWQVPSGLDPERDAERLAQLVANVMQAAEAKDNPVLVVDRPDRVHLWIQAVLAGFPPSARVRLTFATYRGDAESSLGNFLLTGTVHATQNHPAGVDRLGTYYQLLDMTREQPAPASPPSSFARWAARCVLAGNRKHLAHWHHFADAFGSWRPDSSIHGVFAFFRAVFKPDQQVADNAMAHFVELTRGISRPPDEETVGRVIQWGRTQLEQRPAPGRVLSLLRVLHGVCRAARSQPVAEEFGRLALPELQRLAAGPEKTVELLSLLAELRGKAGPIGKQLLESGPDFWLPVLQQLRSHPQRYKVASALTAELLVCGEKHQPKTTSSMIKLAQGLNEAVRMAQGTQNQAALLQQVLDTLVLRILPACAEELRGQLLDKLIDCLGPTYLPDVQLGVFEKLLEAQFSSVRQTPPWLTDALARVLSQTGSLGGLGKLLAQRWQQPGGPEELCRMLCAIPLRKQTGEQEAALFESYCTVFGRLGDDERWATRSNLAQGGKLGWQILLWDFQRSSEEHLEHEAIRDWSLKVFQQKDELRSMWLRIFLPPALFALSKESPSLQIVTETFPAEIWEAQDGHKEQKKTREELVQRYLVEHGLQTEELSRQEKKLLRLAQQPGALDPDLAKCLHQAERITETFSAASEGDPESIRAYLKALPGYAAKVRFDPTALPILLAELDELCNRGDALGQALRQQLSPGFYGQLLERAPEVSADQRQAIEGRLAALWDPARIEDDRFLSSWGKARGRLIVREPDDKGLAARTEQALQELAGRLPQLGEERSGKLHAGFLATATGRAPRQCFEGLFRLVNVWAKGIDSGQPWAGQALPDWLLDYLVPQGQALGLLAELIDCIHRACKAHPTLYLTLRKLASRLALDSQQRHLTLLDPLYNQSLKNAPPGEGWQALCELLNGGKCAYHLVYGDFKARVKTTDMKAEQWRDWFDLVLGRCCVPNMDPRRDAVELVYRRLFEPKPPAGLLEFTRLLAREPGDMLAQQRAALVVAGEVAGLSAKKTGSVQELLDAVPHFRQYVTDQNRSLAAKYSDLLGRFIDCLGEKLKADGLLLLECLAVPGDERRFLDLVGMKALVIFESSSQPATLYNFDRWAYDSPLVLRADSTYLSKSFIPMVLRQNRKKTFGNLHKLVKKKIKAGEIGDVEAAELLRRWSPVT